MITAKEVYDKALAKLDEISESEEMDGWEAFSIFWDWLEREAAQSDAQADGWTREKNGSRSRPIHPEIQKRLPLLKRQ